MKAKRCVLSSVLYVPQITFHIFLSIFLILLIAAKMFIINRFFLCNSFSVISFLNSTISFGCCNFNLINHFTLCSLNTFFCTLFCCVTGLKGCLDMLICETFCFLCCFYFFCGFSNCIIFSMVACSIRVDNVLICKSCAATSPLSC